MDVKFIFSDYSSGYEATKRRTLGKPTEVTLGRLARGETYSRPYLGNSHDKRVSKKEYSASPITMQMTFEAQNESVVNSFMESSKSFIGMPCELHFPELNRKHFGVILYVSTSERLSNRLENSFDITVGFMSSGEEKIDIKEF